MLAEFHRWCDNESEYTYWMRKHRDWIIIAELAVLKLHLSLQELKYSLGGLI